MELYYDVKIIIEDTSLFKETYTGKFRQRDSLDDVFRVLQQIRKFKVEKDIERNTVTLKK
jgi:transmembrane sensor